MTSTSTFELAGLTWQIDPLDLDAQIEVECILLAMLAPSVAAGAASLVQGLAPALVEVLRETVLGGGERITDFENEVLASDAKRSELVDRGTVPDGDYDPATMGRWAIVHPSGRVIAEDNHEGELRKAHGELADAQIQKRGARWLLLTAGHEDKFDIARATKIDTGDPRLRVAWDRLLDALAETGGEVIREVMFTLAQVLSHREIMRLFQLVIFDQRTMVSDPLGERCGRTGDSMEDWKTLSAYLRHDPSAKYELLGKAVMVTYKRKTKKLQPLSAEEEELLAQSSDEGEDA